MKKIIHTTMNYENYNKSMKSKYLIYNSLILFFFIVYCLDCIAHSPLNNKSLKVNLINLTNLIELKLKLLNFSFLV